MRTLTQNYETTSYPNHIILRIRYWCIYISTIIYDRQSNGMILLFGNVCNLTTASDFDSNHGTIVPLFQVRMAILSEFVDEEPQDVDTLLNSLSIPSEFTRHEILDDKDTIARLGEWKVNAFNALKDLRGLLENKRHEIRTSELIYTCAAFQGDGDWISEDMRALSYGKPWYTPSP